MVQDFEGLRLGRAFFYILRGACKPSVQGGHDTCSLQLVFPDLIEPCSMPTRNCHSRADECRGCNSKAQNLAANDTPNPCLRIHVFWVQLERNPHFDDLGFVDEVPESGFVTAVCNDWK